MMRLLAILTALAVSSVPFVSQAGCRSLCRQNRLADRYKLSRLKNLDQLKRFIRLGLLEEAFDTQHLKIDRQQIGRHDRPNARYYAYARPWTVDFLVTLTETVNLGLDKEHIFRVTSLVRTREYQRRLRRRSRWAASGKDRESLSPHLTGAAADISLHGMPRAARQLLLQDLRLLQQDGAVEFLYEKGNNCLHVFVKPDWRKRTLYPVPGC